MQLTLYIGQNVKGKPYHKHDALVNKTMETLGIDACTAWEALGYWMDSDEKTTIIVINDVDDQQVQAWQTPLQKLAKSLKQDAIYQSLTVTHDSVITAEKTA